MDIKLARYVLFSAIFNLAVVATLVGMRPELQSRSNVEDVYRTARNLEHVGAHDQAIHLLEQVVRGGEHTALAPSAAYDIAKIYMRKKFDMFEARYALADMERFRGSTPAEEAARDLAFLDEHWGADGSPVKIWFQASEAYRTGRAADAARLLEPLCKDTPVTTTLRPLALVQRARILVNQGATGEAANLLKSYLADYPEHGDAERARAILRGLS